MNTLVNRIYELAQSQPDKAAVIFKKERLTYQELYRRACAASQRLADLGVQPGDRVCYTVLSKPEMIVTYLGIHMAGGVAVFLDKNGTPENMARVCRMASASVLLTDKKMAGTEPECPVYSLKVFYAETADLEAQDVTITPDPESTAEILFTTGTTSAPKGVILSYRAVYHILSNTIRGLGLTGDDVVLQPLPLNHSLALRVLRASLYAGATVVLQNGFTFAKEVENNISTYHCTVMSCVPTSFEVMKSQMQDQLPRVLGSLRMIEFGAGSLTIRQRREIVSMLPDVEIRNTWGSSESGGAIFCNVSACVRAEQDGSNPELVHSLGMPLSGAVEVRILAQDAPVDQPEQMRGHLAEYFIDSDAAHPGRMILRGDMTMSGYWQNETVTAQSLIDGWLLTGDMAYTDDLGNVYMLGRADDIINVGGEKVSPIEVEELAGQFPAVRECACIGVEDPDGITGQIPVLFAAVTPEYNEDELIRFMAARTERCKIPQRFVRIEALPRNRMQKIDRKALRGLWENQSSNVLMNPVVDAILSRHSVRKFTEQEISRDILDMILQCGYHAPSGHNMQTWRFTVLTRQDEIRTLREAAAETAREHKVNFYGWENPQVLILVSNDKRNDDGCQDASCAAENMMLAAQSYGIGSVWLNPLMTLRDAEPVKSVLDAYGVPAGHTVWASIALGYPAGDAASLQRKTDVVVIR